MEDKYMLNTLLAAVVALGCLALLLVQALLPAAVLPALDLPALAALSIVALVVERYLLPTLPRRNWPLVLLLGALSFGLLPLCAGLVAGQAALLLGLAGAATFGVLTFLFTSLSQRLASGPAGRLSPALAGVVLFLACQSLAGMIL